MTIHYKVYQIDLTRPEAEGLAFRPFAPCVDGGDSINSDAYAQVYCGELECEPDWVPANILERLFYLLNMKHPADYKARSLSVSDVVALPGEDGERFYYCDTCGFRQVRFFPQSGTSAACK